MFRTLPDTPATYHEHLIQTVHRNKQNFLEQGSVLSRLRKNSAYRETTGGIDSWHEYLSQPEIGMSPTQANKLINIYELFIKKLNYAQESIIEIPIKTLSYIIKRKEEFEAFSKAKQDEIIDQAKVLSFKDFKEAYFDQKSEESGEVRTYDFVLMKKCHQTGTMTKVHELDSNTLAQLVTPIIITSR